MEALEAFKNSSNPFVDNYELCKYGIDVNLTPYLEEFFLNMLGSSELKILTALLLLRDGSDIGIDYLLKVVIKDNMYPSLFSCSVFGKERNY